MVDDDDDEVDYEKLLQDIIKENMARINAIKESYEKLIIE